MRLNRGESTQACCRSATDRAISMTRSERGGDQGGAVRERLLAAMRARLRQVAESRDVSPVLKRRAVREARQLAEVQALAPLPQDHPIAPLCCCTSTLLFSDLQVSEVPVGYAPFVTE